MSWFKRDTTPLGTIRVNLREDGRYVVERYESFEGIKHWSWEKFFDTQGAATDYAKDLCDKQKASQAFTPIIFCGGAE